MTVTISLPPETEVLLREKAQFEGLDPETVAAILLASALAWKEEDRAEAIEGIQRGLDDFAAGRFRLFSEFAAEQRRRYRLP